MIPGILIGLATGYILGRAHYWLKLRRAQRWMEANARERARGREKLNHMDLKDPFG